MNCKTCGNNVIEGFVHIVDGAVMCDECRLEQIREEVVHRGNDYY